MNKINFRKYETRTSNTCKCNRGINKKSCIVALIGIMLFALCGCRGGDDTIPTLPPKEVPKQIPGALLPESGSWLKSSCEIIEDANMLHYLDGQLITTQPQSFYVNEHSIWQNSCDNTAYEVYKDKKDDYDEDFFDEHILVCGVDTSNAGLEYEFEGAMVSTETIGKVLTIYISYSEDNKQNNKLANYYTFLELDKDEINEIDIIRVEPFLRAK